MFERGLMWHITIDWEASPNRSPYPLFAMDASITCTKATLERFITMLNEFGDVTVTSPNGSPYEH